MWTHLPARVLSDCDVECHSCGHATTGYQMGELIVDHGWRLHSTGVGRAMFIMCADCEQTYEKRRDPDVTRRS
jgi:hypothetical protein